MNINPLFRETTTNQINNQLNTINEILNRNYQIDQLNKMIEQLDQLEEITNQENNPQRRSLFQMLQSILIDSIINNINQSL